MNSCRSRPSPYNFFFKTLIGPDYIGYNSFTNALIEFTPEDYNLIKKIMSEYSRDSYNNRELYILKILESCGFVVDDYFDYLDELRKRFFTEHKSLSLTIVPTLNCNFRCKYCFEDKNNQTMSKRTQEDLLSFVENHLPDSSTLNITFFGGEPLLAIDIVEYLSIEMSKICKKKNAGFNNGMIITNGYLLTPGVAGKLRSLGVTSAQITLDGPPEIHNKNRPLANGKETFEVIFNNIKASKDIIRIVVRANVLRDNLDAIYLLEELFYNSGITDISLYPGHVQALTECCKDISQICMSDEEFLSLKWRFELHQVAKGKHVPSYPTLMYGFCTATNPHGFLVAPSGALFKCWNETSFTKDFSIGNVSEDTTSLMTKNLDKWSKWSPLNQAICIECKYLPICMGGCPYIAIANLRHSCSEYKTYLEEYVTLRHALGRIYDVNKVISYMK